MARVTIIGDDAGVLAWMQAQFGSSAISSNYRGIGLWDTDRREYIAGTLFCEFNGVSMHGHIAIAPDVKNVGKHWLAFWCQYVFNQCKVRKLIGPISEANLASRRFVEKFGFSLEATLKDAHPDGDLLLYSLTADKCSKWLNVNVPSEALYVVPQT